MAPPISFGLGLSLARAGGAAFSPLSLAPALWLSDTGSNAAQWDDLSGNGRHAVQATGINQPAITTNALNGRQVRTFDGTNDILVAPSMTYRTGFVVARATATPVALAGLIAGGHTTDFSLRLSGTVGAQQYRGTTSTNSGDWSNGNTSNFFINGANAEAITYGTYHIVSAEATAAYTGTISLGQAFNTRLWKGDIAEVLIFSGTLSAANRTKVHRYLSQKYAIALV